MCNNMVMPEAIYDEIGAMLRKIRKERGLRIREVAGILNMKEACLSRYETGSVRIPIKILIELLRFFNLALILSPRTNNDNKRGRRGYQLELVKQVQSVLPELSPGLTSE
jgi:transcriptional regulator with XRE-family HTH domain